MKYTINIMYVSHSMFMSHVISKNLGVFNDLKSACVELQKLLWLKDSNLTIKEIRTFMYNNKGYIIYDNNIEYTLKIIQVDDYKVKDNLSFLKNINTKFNNSISFE